MAAKVGCESNLEMSIKFFQLVPTSRLEGVVAYVGLDLVVPSRSPDPQLSIVSLDPDGPMDFATTYLPVHGVVGPDFKVEIS